MPAPPHRLGDYRDVDVVAVAAQADARHSLLVFVMPNNAHRRTALNTHGVSQLTCKHGGVDDTSGDSWRKREGALTITLLFSAPPSSGSRKRERLAVWPALPTLQTKWWQAARESWLAVPKGPYPLKQLRQRRRKLVAGLALSCPTGNQENAGFRGTDPSWLHILN